KTEATGGCRHLFALAASCREMRAFGAHTGHWYRGAGLRASNLPAFTAVPPHPRTVLSMAQREILFSVDVEADGPIPGPYSMSSLGACVFAVTTADKAGRMMVTPVDVETHTF